MTLYVPTRLEDGPPTGAGSRGIRTWDQRTTFIFKAGRVVVQMVLNLLSAVGTVGRFGNEDSVKSLLDHRQCAGICSRFWVDAQSWPG